MMRGKRKVFQLVAATAPICVAVSLIPELALAQATDPFETGASNLQTALVALGTPVAVLLVMGLGIAAAAGKISWSWVIGVLVGVGLVFAAPNIVTWAKSLFGA